MKHDDNLNKQPHWRCRLCGHSTPLGEAVCSNPSCGADLGIYGEAVTPGGEETDRTYQKSRDDGAQRQKEEAQWKAEEERQRRENAQQQKAEEKARKKADRQAHRSGSGPKWLIPALAAALIVALGAGAAVMFLNRDAVDDPTPPRQSDAPGPSESQPGQEEVPSSDENQPGQPEAPAPGVQKSGVLMEDPNLADDESQRKDYPVFGFDGAISREDIVSITFLDSLDRLHGTDWDVSAAQDGSVMAWADVRGDGMYDLYIGAEGGVEAPENCYGLFMSYINLESISFNGAFHTENTTNMQAMFDHCDRLTKLDVGGFNTSHVTTMFGMFYECGGLQELDLSGFDTSSVTDMGFLFCECESLTTLDMSGFNTSNVTNMRAMFNGCRALEVLDVGGFDTSRATTMRAMFCNCTALRELDVTGFNTSSVTSMSYMFHHCSGLDQLDVSGFDTSNVTDMSYMFYHCSGLDQLNITNFRTSKVTDMSYMFAGVSSGFSLNFSRDTFDTSNVENNEGFMDDGFDWRKIFE